MTRPQGAACDIGAYELQRIATTLTAEPVLRNFPALVAHLTADGQPLAGKTIAFTTTNLLGQPVALCQAVTDNAGTARCNGGLGVLLALSTQYTATFAGDALYLGSTAQGRLH